MPSPHDRTKSFTLPVVLAAVVVSFGGFATASIAGWPLWLRLTTGLFGLGLVALAAQQQSIGRALNRWLAKASPRVGASIERFLADPHEPKTQRRCLTAALATTGVALLWLLLGGGQWALALACSGASAIFFYWGSKVCTGHRANPPVDQPTAEPATLLPPKRAVAAVATGSYFLSLSANFVAGALVGSTSLDQSFAAVNATLHRIEVRVHDIYEAVVGIDETTRRIDATTTRSEEKIDQQSEDLAHLRQMLSEHLALKPASQDADTPPALPELTPQIRDAAQRLLAEGDAADRAAASLALGDFEKARSHLRDAGLDQAIDRAFDLLTTQGNIEYYAGNYDAAIEPYEKALALRPRDPAALFLVAIAHYDARLGDIPAHRDRAIECFLVAMETWTLATHPVNWAATQNNLGLTWQILPTGDRGENLRSAIACYTAALVVRTRDAHPAAWASTQQNLGTAWATLPNGDPGENLRAAIACYTAALEVRTRDAHPVDWAATQNNLGNSWLFLPTGNRGENLRSAITCYTAALEVRTLAAHPVGWASTKNNLGGALSALAERPGQDRPLLLRQAIASSKAALLVFTPTAFPREHTGTTDNLAIFRARYESLNLHTGPTGIPFDDIPPAP